MPLLAAGDQGHHPEQMFDAIVGAAFHWMTRGLGIEELKLVILDNDTAETMATRLLSMQLSEQERLAPVSESFDVFLSFSNKDHEAADVAKAALLARNDVESIFDYRLEIDRGVSWQREIDRAITSSNAIVAITSPDYFASPECQEELAQARLRHKREGGARLFPVYWRSTQEEMDLWLQVINMSDCRERDSEKLVRELQGLQFRGA